MINTFEMFTSIFTIKNIIIYLIIINIITFFTMFWDKHQAERGHFRISEKALFILALIGGAIGGIAGMYTFRHKTKKWYFKYGFPAIILFQIFLIIYFTVIV